MITESSLKLSVRAFYEDYFACLDSHDMHAWPDFFTEDTTYQIQSEESHRSGYMIGDMFCVSRDMIRDRATAILSTMVHERRILRHFPGTLRVGPLSGNKVATQMTYLVIESVIDEMPAVFSVGRSIDEILFRDDRLRFSSRTVLYDHPYIRNSLVYPL
jgi:3-phenylpropionate/cinnamic acid dioxygenase small subunit